MGLYYSKELDNNARIAVWEITETEEELRAICDFPSDEEEEFNMAKSAQRRKERMAVRLLLDYLFPERVYLAYHDNGRPYLQNSIVEISISHTKRFACVLTHPELSVGVDIEYTRRNFAAVEQKALNDDERDFLSEKAPVRDLQLALIWSAKEALFKYKSQSGVDYARRMCIDKFTPHDEGEMEAVFYEKDGEELYFTPQYQVLDDHIMVWIVGEED